ncbi:hypothetical protein A7D17_21725 [Xanthomonas floridensis]|uniref:Uncharacterized protein n=1 Tax=Xanthomonas floridensis TaxID=1843580 RepID=A0A1A9MA35_9XANT|nr:hypothetical protein A7D17_21725 [Xanthomonas floridensis]
MLHPFQLRQAVRPQCPPLAMLHCSVICSLMIAIFICEQSGARRLVDVAMPSCCSPVPAQPHAALMASSERCA